LFVLGREAFLEIGAFVLLKMVREEEETYNGYVLASTTVSFLRKRELLTSDHRNRCIGE
jgi:hypothetical protein